MFSVFVAALCRTRIQYCWISLSCVPRPSSTPYLFLFTLSRLVITILIIIINKYKILNNRLKYLLNYLQYLFLLFARPTKSRWTFQFALSFFKEGLLVLALFQIIFIIFSWLGFLLGWSISFGCCGDCETECWDALGSLLFQAFVNTNGQCHILPFCSLLL